MPSDLSGVSHLRLYSLICCVVFTLLKHQVMRACLILVGGECNDLINISPFVILFISEICGLLYFV